MLLEDPYDPTDDALTNIREPSDKSGMIVQRDVYLNVLKDKFQNGLPSIRFLDEKFATIPLFMLFNRNLPYTERFLEEVNAMVESGVIQHMFNLVVSKHKPRKRDELVPPQVLTVHTLRLGFYGFMIECALCILVFICEILFAACKATATRVFN